MNQIACLYCSGGFCSQFAHVAGGACFRCSGTGYENPTRAQVAAARIRFGIDRAPMKAPARKSKDVEIDFGGVVESVTIFAPDSDGDLEIWFERTEDGTCFSTCLMFRIEDGQVIVEPILSERFWHSQEVVQAGLQAALKVRTAA